MFKNTQRKITLAFKIPCASMSEAYDMLARVQELTHYLYPTYANPGNATTITQSPLVRLGVMNLVADNEQSTTREAVGQGMHEKMIRPASAGNPAFGLLGVVNNLTVNHNLESDDGILEVHENFILPKLIEVNLDFSPIHEQVLGWNEKQKFSAPHFPYGTGELPDVDKANQESQANNAKSYNAAVEREKAIARLREEAQAIIDNASARYMDASGELNTRRMNRDAAKANRLAQRGAKKMVNSVRDDGTYNMNKYARGQALRDEAESIQDMHDVYGAPGHAGNVWGTE
jgi:hypothetical protein